MGSRTTEKIIDALTQLLEGFNELHQSLEEDYAEKDIEEAEDSDEELEGVPELEAALVSEIKVALEAVIEGEDYAPEEIATLISVVTEALQEIEPDLFEEESPAADLVEEDGDDDLDEDIDLDDDDLEYEDEDEDDDEEDEEEDDEDDEIDLDDEELDEDEEEDD